METKVATSPKPAKPERPSNTIGALRLLFAALVIVSHSYEMLDNSATHEPLHRLFHTLTLGELAVDGFFLISGYLITASFVSSAGVGAYFMKRILRIYPAFVICSLVCIFVIAPVGGASLWTQSAGDWARVAYRIVMLKPPETPGVFIGLPNPTLNGSAWSISYEFRCYILVALLGLIGLYRRPRIFTALTLAVVVAGIAMAWSGPVARAPGWFEAAFGDPVQDARLLGAFMTGGCFWLYRQSISLKGLYAAAAAVLLCGLMFSPHFAEPALVVLGGYILFWTSFKVRWKPLLTINAKDDISYGTYLYAWPIALLILWAWRGAPAPALTLLTMAGALAAGAVSWFLIEKPALRWKPRMRPAGPETGAPAVAGPQDAPALQQRA